MIGDEKLSCFEALILIIPEKNHQLFSWIVAVHASKIKFRKKSGKTKLKYS